MQNFTAHMENIIIDYLNLTLYWNASKLFSSFQNHLVNIRETVVNEQELEEEAKRSWDKAINEISSYINLELENVFPELIEENFISDTYIEDLKEQILDAKSIGNFEEKVEMGHKDFSKVDKIISEIKNEVEKGNRVNFKLILELQSMIEQLTSDSADKEMIENAIKDYKKKVDNSLKLNLKAIDYLGVMYESAKKTDVKEWASRNKLFIEEFLQELDLDGIKEIQVNGKFFDGKTMESVGTVPSNFAPDLEKYQVYTVFERGFCFKESGKLIRRAKVITIY